MKDTSQPINGPVVIGGVGGSGTRVITQILLELGYFMGHDFKNTYDNLLFSLLFKRPKWVYDNLNKNNEEIFRSLMIFRKGMLGESRYRLDELLFIIRAVFDTGFRGNNHLRKDRGLWPVYRLMKILIAKKVSIELYNGWGWKEPNSHIFIECFDNFFPDMKYIHTIRHGLDMSYSKNQQQLYNWGRLFGIHIPSNQELIPKASLDYWIKANERVLEYRKQLGENRILILNFDKLCRDPKKGIERVVDFLEIARTNSDVDKLCQLIKIPNSTGRYKKYDSSIFDKQEIDAVRRLDFDVEIPEKSSAQMRLADKSCS